MVDDNVFFDHTVQMIDSLQVVSTPFEMMTYPGKKHSVSGAAQRKHLWNLYLDFLTGI